MAKDLKITVSIEEMRTATQDQNLSLTDFCKLNQVPAKTTVWRYCKESQIDTSEGLTVNAEDALRHEYGLPSVSEIQTAIEESQLPQKIEAEQAGILEGELVHVPNTDLGFGLSSEAPIVVNNYYINTGNGADLAVANQNSENRITQMLQQLSGAAEQMGINAGVEVHQTGEMMKNTLIERYLGNMAASMNQAHNPVASQEPHTPPPMTPRSPNGKGKK